MTPTTEAGKVLADWLTFAAKRADGVPAPDAVAEVEAEARTAALRDLREKVAGLFTPADYVRDNGVDGRLTWPDGWDSGVERVLALIDGA